MYKYLRLLSYLLFRPIWWIQKIIPRSKRIWIFGSWYGEKYSDNSKYLFEYISANSNEIKAIWLTKSEKVFKELQLKKTKVYKNNSIKCIYFTLRAKYCFINNGIDDFNKYFLNGCKQIWLWHGMPLKKIEHSLEVENNIYNKKYKIYKAIVPYNNKNPYVTISSSYFFNNYLKDAFCVSDLNLLKTGLPRCDVLFTNKCDYFVSNLRSKFNNPRVILYLPTFRKIGIDIGESFHPFKKSYGFDSDELIKFLEENNCVLLYKSHFVDSDLERFYLGKRFIQVSDNDYDDLYLLLNSVDILITDYSSVYFDFVVKNKPIYLFTFDYADYTSLSRSHYFNMYTEMQGVYCSDWKDFYVKFIENKGKESVSRELREKFASYVRGNSCELIYKEMMKLSGLEYKIK